MLISAVWLEALDESRHNAVTTLAFIIPTELMPVCLASIPKAGEGLNMRLMFLPVLASSYSFHPTNTHSELQCQLQMQYQLSAQQREQITELKKQLRRWRYFTTIKWLILGFHTLCCLTYVRNSINCVTYFVHLVTFSSNLNYKRSVPV